MAPDTPDKSGSTRQPWKLLLAAGSALLLAMVTAIGSGLGSSLLDLFKGEESPLSYSAAEQVTDCGTKIFVAGDQAASIASGKVPTPTLPPEPGVDITHADWGSFQRSTGGVVVDESIVDVSIQGESSRTVTLTGIDFSVERRPRPSGAVFNNLCGGPVTGRYVVADLDREPVAVIGTAQDPNALLTLNPASSPYEPIRFPWTVSLTDPLQLKIIARTRGCYCVWRAEIPWSSGGKTGVIRIDNGGKGYAVVGSEGATEYARSPSTRSGWAPYASGSSSP